MKSSKEIILETERLFLREITQHDAENAYLLNLDPDVLKYTGDKPFSSIDQARYFLKNYDHYKKYGFGRWGMISKAGGEFLGWCGLKYTEELDEHDVGFRLFKKYWNKGFATEAALASVGVGFDRFKLKTIVGRAMKENLASIRVLEKTGMSYYKPFQFDGEEGVVYKIETPFTEK